jgi:hypothetical protein
MLVNCLSLTAKNMMNAAIIVVEMERRGEDVEGLKISLLHHLRKVACGQLLPEIIVRFAGSPLLIGCIGNLPISSQRKIADGEPVLMSLPGADNHRMVDPLTMTRSQISIVFARDHIRTHAEQLVLLDHRKQQAAKPIPESIGKVRIDRERGGIVVGRTFVPKCDVLAAIKLL